MGGDGCRMLCGVVLVVCLCVTCFPFHPLQQSAVLVVCLCVRPVSLFTPCSGVLFLSCVCV